MLFPYGQETKSITEKMLQDASDSNRQARIRYYEARYNEFEGRVFYNTTQNTSSSADPNSNSPSANGSAYFPRLHKESNGAYAERVKIWIPWSSIVCRRFAATCLKEPVERKFEAIEKSNQSIADDANAYLAECYERNDWTTLMQNVFTYALGIGEMSLWPEWVAYDKQSGEKIKIGNAIGYVKWTDWFPWFVEPIARDSDVSLDAGAVKIYYFDGQQATTYLSQTIGSKEKVCVELWMAPLFESKTGNNKDLGGHLIWENGEPDESANIDGFDWSNQNYYGCNPVVTFVSPDPDESGYRGKSFYDRFAHLAHEHSLAFSRIGQSVRLMRSLWQFKGSKTDAEKFMLRESVVNVISSQTEDGSPTEGLEQIVNQLNLEWDFKNSEAITGLIALAAQFPIQAFDSPTLGGNVESGVALKIILEPFIEAIDSMHRVFAKAETKAMTVMVKMRNAHNKGKEIDLSKIRPVVKYNRDLIPLNEAAVFASNVEKLANGVITQEELIQKYNPHLDQAQVKERADAFTSKKQAQQKQFSFNPLRNNQTNQ